MRNILLSTNRHPNLLQLLIAGLAMPVLTIGLSQQAQAVGQGNRSDNGPVRMARFSYVSGDVNWRRDSRAPWSRARMNLPIRQGTQIWASNNGRAECQFDDGSRFRLGGGALVTLQTLYSDRDGEFSEITLTNGTVAMRLMHEHSVYQVNTPVVSLNATGPARFRVGAGNGTRIAILAGRAEIEGRQGKAKCQAGDYYDLRNDNDPYDIRPLPRPDNFANWCDARDRNIDGYATHHAHRTLPPNIALVADDLDDYGSWRSDPQYGEIWYPRYSSSNWRPYSHGDWVWVEPYGWTWVDQEPWGWAPSHYGTWVHRSYGWGWVHGPSNQYWSPGVVAFHDYGGSQVWVALAPAEVMYPATLGIGFRSGDWSLFFSIGQAGVYYPSRNNVYLGNPWSSDYVNRVTYINNTTVYNTTNIYNSSIVNRNPYLANTQYVPFNARYGGATMADARAFGGQGTYRPVAQASVSNVYSRARVVGAPPSGQYAVSGPSAVRPTALSLTPERRYSSNVRVPQTALAQPVYRAPLRPEIARVSTTAIRTLPVNTSPRILGRTKAGPAEIRAHVSPKTAPTVLVPGKTTGPARPGAAATRPVVSPPIKGNRPPVGLPGAGAAKPSAADRAKRAREGLGMNPSVAQPNRPVTVRPGNKQQAAPQRQQAAPQRQQAAPQRQQAAPQRQQAAPQRQQAAPQRQQAAPQRERAAPSQPKQRNDRAPQRATTPESPRKQDGGKDKKDGRG